MRFSRRTFLKSTGAAAGFGASGQAVGASACMADPPVPDTTVRLFGDGLGLTAAAWSGLLASLCAGREVAQDTYLLGGEVEAFERRAARVLGKERAVFMPSGTLANQLALRALAGPWKRVVVPQESHVYNDTGDASQTLSAQSLVPLAPGRAGFSVQEVAAVVERTAGGRVATDVGALLVESPVRRRSGQTFDRNEIALLADFAAAEGMGMHLDGARLFIESAYSGMTPAELAAPFDTVYVSLWKYFNSGVGAILAGPEALLADLYHVRRMFGGNLFQGWAAALVAGYYMDGFVERLQAAIGVAEVFLSSIDAHPAVRVERIPDGTNVVRLVIRGVDSAALTGRLARREILLRPGQDGVFTLGVNETWNRTTGEALAEAFEAALG